MPLRSHRVGTPHEAPRGRVIFIHGLGGHHHHTWCHTDDSPTSFWPRWLADAFPELAVFTLEYPAGALGVNKEIGIDINERARTVLDYLTNEYLHDDTPLFFIVHSMGGLILKSLLRMSKEDIDHPDTEQRRRAQIWLKTKGIVFLATPHIGSRYASLLGRLPFLPSDATMSMVYGSTALLELNNWYTTQVLLNSRIPTKVYYELRVTFFAKIVSRESAFLPGADVAGADDDHISIAKPLSRRSPVVLGVTAWIGRAFDLPNEAIRRFREIPEPADEPVVTPPPHIYPRWLAIIASFLTLLVAYSVGWQYIRTAPEYRIALLLNEDAEHIRTAAFSFEHRIHERMGRYQNIEVSIGSANKKDDSTNEKAFNAALGKLEGAPDVLVTVGTQVSVYAAKHYARLPRFFLVVTDPVGSKIIESTSSGSRGGNVAGFGTGVDRERMVDDLAACFPMQRLGFIYNPDQEQDEIMLNFFESSRKLKIVPVQGTQEYKIAAPVLENVKIFFGWNWLNTKLGHYIKENPTALFIGPQYVNIEEGVIASYGADYAHIGSEAADLLMEEFFGWNIMGRRQPMSEVSVVLPHRARLQVRKRILFRSEMTLGPDCDPVWVP